MQELIKVQKIFINGADINSVNARDLHKNLGLRSDFSNWAKRVLDIFIENEDYIRFDKKVEANNATMIEYILTLDTAKHISMLQKNDIGMKLRKYFIDVEKEAKQLRIPTDPMEILSLVFDAQKATNIELIEIKTEIEELKGDIVLTPSQKRILQKAVATKVYSFEGKQEHNKKLFSKIYSKLKDRFAVSSYMEIPRLSFNEAKSMVDNITLIDLV